MRPRSRWRAVAAAAFVVAALTALPAAASGGAVGGAAVGGETGRTTTAGGPVPVSSHTDDDALPVSVEITAVTPQVLRPGQDLTVTARLTNTSAAPVAEPRAFLHVDRRSYISRTSLDTWRTASPRGELGPVVTEVDTGAVLAPGASTTVTLSVPADGLGLGRGERAWGPRGIAMQVVDAADPARIRLGAARTFALWFPLEEVTPTRLSVLVPLVGPALDPYSTAWAEDLETMTSQGRLADVLAATEEHPSVTWVLDPWLLDVAAERSGATGGTAGEDAEDTEGDADQENPSDGGGDEPGAGEDGGAGSGDDGAPATAEPAPSSPSPSADPGAGTDERAGGFDDALPDLTATQEWAAGVVAGATDREVHLLPYLDADAAALAHLDAVDLLGRATERSVRAARDAGLPTSGNPLLTWPAPDLPDLATAAAARSLGARAVVVGPGELLPPAVLTYTPTGRATVDTARGELSALVPDERLSDGLRSGSLVQDEDGPRDDDAQRTPATAAQDLLAELAVITRERPTDSRHVLATLPRDWSPDPAVVEAQLTALAAAPWVRGEPVTALVGAAEPGVDRGTLPARVVGEREVSGALLQDVAAAVAQRTALAAMVPRPELLLGDGDLEVLAPTSVAWRERPADRRELAAGAQARTAALAEAVAVVPGSDLTIIATSAGMPVRLTNALDQDVSVVVDLRPDSARLRSNGAVATTVPANGETMVQVPVHAIQSADVQVAVEVRTPDGVLVDDDTVIAVRVRADWEGIGTAVIGGVLALGLVVGLIRSIRRGRTGRRGRPQLDSGPDALSPEEAAEAGHPTDEDPVPSTGAAARDRAPAAAVDETGRGGPQDGPPSAVGTPAAGTGPRRHDDPEGAG
nr:DUF6049 family protein [uncultured Actinotalea sp.]